MCGHNMAKTSNKKTTTDELTSSDLAAFIIDALLLAKIIKKEDVDRALSIATEEIEVRKSLGDY